MGWYASGEVILHLSKAEADLDHDFSSIPGGGSARGCRRGPPSATTGDGSASPIAPTFGTAGSMRLGWCFVWRSSVGKQSLVCIGEGNGVRVTMFGEVVGEVGLKELKTVVV